jgi:general secretion pathway protein A
MYTEYYQLREKPFSLSPDPRFLYLSASHREALAHVLYGIDQGEGFIAVTGEVGTGKTTLCRTLLERMGPQAEVAFLFNPSLSGEDLLRTICIELGLPVRDRSRAALHDELNTFLLTMHRDGRRVLLIVDEAQNLTFEALEEIRLLSNLETSTSKLIQIVLFGQPELDDQIDSHALRQLRQRISVRWRLAPLSAGESREYVQHRLRVAAGGTRDLFTPAALREIRRRARGIPRLLNLLADRSLLAGYASGAERVDTTHVGQAAREILNARRRRGARRFAGWRTLVTKSAGRGTSR